MISHHAREDSYSMEGTYRYLNEKYTPKRQPKREQPKILDHDNLAQISRKLELVNDIKNDQTATLGKYDKSKIYELLKARKSIDKENGSNTYSKLFDQRQTPLRERINSYREEKKPTINTFRTQKETAGTYNTQYPQQQQGRAADETRDSYTIATHQKPKAATTIDHNQQLSGTVSLLVQQNEKLAMRVGQLESLCQAMSHKLGYFKAKYEQQTHRLKGEKVQQERENVYLEKLVYYYKSLAFRLQEKLKENGIEVDEQQVTESSAAMMTELSQT